MKELEKEILKFLTDRNWNNLPPSNIAKSISIESAELLECFQWINPNIKDVKNNKKLLSKVSKEIADVMIYSLELTIILGLNPKKIILSKLSEINKKYPADLMKEKNADEQYYNIKKAMREKK